MKLKLFLTVLSIFFLLIFSVFTYQLVKYNKYQKSNYKQLSYCYEKQDNNYKDQDSCCCKMYSLLVPKLLIYKAYNNNKPLKFVRESALALIIPEIAIQNADALVGYGSTFELGFLNILADLYKKQAFIFNNNSYEKKIKELVSENKKIFFAFDVMTDSNYDISDILKYKNNITGMNISIYIYNSKRIIDVIKTLEMFEKDFVLVARNYNTNLTYMGSNCKYCGHNFPKALYLTYINKNLVNYKYIPFNQDTVLPKYYETKVYKRNAYAPEVNINWRIIVSAYINNSLKKLNDKLKNKKSVDKV